MVDTTYPPLVVYIFRFRLNPGEKLNDELSVLFAKRFIQRRDVKAIQFSSGGYSPDRELEKLGKHAPVGWEMHHLRQHLEGTATYGHYLLDQTDQCRVFALDIDLQKTGYYVPIPTWSENISEDDWEKKTEPIACNLREIWADRTQIEARNWLKYQMKSLAHKFTSIIHEQLNLPCAAAYSGNKGIHIYGFTGPLPASEVREAALFVLDFTDEWELSRGQHIYSHKISEPELGFQNFTIEVYPKQSSLEGKDLGNLLRLPLGKNLKSTDPTFFIDLTSPLGVLRPHADPVKLLETGNPYA